MPGADAAAAELGAAAAGRRPGPRRSRTVEVALDCRYAGQSHELTVPAVAAFAAEHVRRNGFRHGRTAVEVVALRASARWPSPVDLAGLRRGPTERARWPGPAVIAEPDCTIWVAAGWRAAVHPSGSWLLTRGGLTVDPAALQVLISQLTGVATEMGEVLRRSALSPNIKERADCSAAVFTAAGELLVQAEHIPVHLGSMPASVAAAIEAGLDLGPGDQVVLNDPFAGGTHLNDVTLVAPCHAGGRLVGWVANRAHHADVGGMVAGLDPARGDGDLPGGPAHPAGAADRRGGRPAAGQLADPGANGGATSTPRPAPTGSASSGWPRWPIGSRDFDEVLAYGERRMRAALAALPDGTLHGRGRHGLDPARHLLGSAPVAIRLTVDRSRALRSPSTSVAPSRSSPATSTPWRRSPPARWRGRCAAPPIPPSRPTGAPCGRSGWSSRPALSWAPGPPAAVGAGNVEVSQRVADVCLRALAQAAPDRVGAAGQGTMNNLILGGRSGWVYYETIGGGQGGRPGRAGMNGVHTAMTNTMDTPTEALERAHPVRVLRYRLRDGSGGAGRWPGGDGIERVIQVLEPATLSLITERRVSRPVGPGGRRPGCGGRELAVAGRRRVAPGAARRQGDGGAGGRWTRCSCSRRAGAAGVCRHRLTARGRRPGSRGAGSHRSGVGWGQ